MYLDPSWLLLMVISTVLGFVTQGYINRTFRRWSNVPLPGGLSGAEVARRILDANGLQSVPVNPVGGNLTDHYDPRDKTLALSAPVFGAPSVAAAGVAAHEAGHAIQDAQGYAFGKVRSALVPVANFGSRAAFPLIFIGLFFRALGPIGAGMVWAGVIFFAAAVLFQLVTLPVEFDASRRAIATLDSTGIMGPNELGGARHVLTAAALTYLAAALISVLQLLYFIGLARRD